MSSLLTCNSCGESSLSVPSNKTVKGSGKFECSSVSVSDAVSVSLFSKLVSTAAPGAIICNSLMSSSVNTVKGEQGNYNTIGFYNSIVTFPQRFFFFCVSISPSVCIIIYHFKWLVHNLDLDTLISRMLGFTQSNYHNTIQHGMQLCITV